MQMDKEQEIVIESGIITEAKFDETEFYQKEIEPRIMELAKLCKGKSEKEYICYVYNVL